MSAGSHPPFRFSTKAGNLAQLDGRLLTARTAPQEVVRVGDWRAQPDQCVARLQQRFPDVPLIVRSSAPGEDSKEASMAGAFESILNVSSDDDAVWDKSVTIDAATLTPQVSWGTNPGQVMSIDGTLPDPASYADATARDTVARALEYMGLTPGTAIRDIRPDTVFIGSCTNSRIEDLRAAAAVLEGRTVTVPRVMVVPGSHAVKAQAEAEGLHEIFRAAGADWREPGCSMCLAMNPDKLAPGERSASTSNRNFEGRQGRGGRTHLVSPAVAAATAVAGHFTTPQDL